jgi:hypothetical protein
MPPPNNGTHPTAGTQDFMLRQRLGVAGDARRYAASLMGENESTNLMRSG